MGKDILVLLNETHKYSLAAIYNQSYLPLASANFDLFKKSLLVALDRKLVSHGWYAAQLPLVVSIGKEIGKWLYSKQARAPK